MREQGRECDRDGGSKLDGLQACREVEWERRLVTISPDDTDGLAVGLESCCLRGDLAEEEEPRPDGLVVTLGAPAPVAEKRPWDRR